MAAEDEASKRTQRVPCFKGQGSVTNRSGTVAAAPNLFGFRDLMGSRPSVCVTECRLDWDRSARTGQVVCTGALRGRVLRGSVDFHGLRRVEFGRRVRLI